MKCETHHSVSACETLPAGAPALPGGSDVNGFLEVDDRIRLPLACQAGCAGQPDPAHKSRGTAVDQMDGTRQATLA
jgi:hypothetical protein